MRAPVSRYVIDPVEYQYVPVLDCSTQAHAMGEFCDLHVKLHVIGVYGEHEPRALRFLHTDLMQIVQLFRAGPKLFLLLRRHLLGT